jgi:asparagine synthase (glutamine-hydrolysing)
MLARSVRDHGFKVALTGEGADEWLAGYPWFKIHKVLSAFDVVPGLSLGLALRRLGLRLTGQPMFEKRLIRQAQEAVGGHNGWMDVYGMMSLNKLRFYTPAMKERLVDHSAYDDLALDREAMLKWHPFNRSLYLGGRIMLAGHLLCSKGDRVAMHSSVETRYPFLDEQVIAFLAKLHPRWKLRGLTDKYLLRRLALRWLPKEIATRRKAMFRAPMDSFHLAEGSREKWIDEVLSPESLRKTGYFDVEAVLHWRKTLPQMRRRLSRTSVEMGLVAVLGTQLWHHLYVSGDLASIPSVVRGPERRAEALAAAR